MGTECRSCLYDSNHPFGIEFDNSNLCSGCAYHMEKDEIDWKFQLSQLQLLLKDYRSNQGNTDCIVPITGGQDSFFILHFVINVLKLNPLIVNFNRNFNSKIGLANLARLRSTFDCNFQQLTPSRNLAQRIVRTTLSKLGTLNWLNIAGQTSYPVRLSVEKKIPLIIWGAHQGNEQVGMFKHSDAVEMTRRYRRDIDLMGMDETDLWMMDADVSDAELSLISYPSDNLLTQIGTKGIYLGNFVRWDPVAQHDFTVKTYGYLGQSSNRTYYPYDNPDCEFYNGFQDYLKFIKLGYSKVTDQLVRDIRHGRITRNQALVVKKKYETNQPENINELAKWLNCTFEALNLSILNFARDFQEQIVNENWRARLSKFPTDENISQSSYTTDRLFLSRDERASEFGRGQWKNEIEC